MNYTIKNDYISVTVSEYGAELQSIQDNEGIEYLWQGDSKYWSDRAPNLFPFIARLYKGSYLYLGNSYKMDIHGFACRSIFKLAKKTQTCICFELTDNEFTYQKYPCKFIFRIEYTLDENRVAIRYEVANTDEKTIFFAVGGHPGFNVPITSKLNFSDYYLVFSEPCNPQRVGFTENVLLSGIDQNYALQDGMKLPLTHELFNNDAIILKNTAHQITLESDKDTHYVRVSFPDMDYIGLWHKSLSDAPYICIEPWSSLPAKDGEITQFEKKRDLLTLEPTKKHVNNWVIEVGGNFSSAFSF